MYDVPYPWTRDAVKETYRNFPGHVVGFLLEDGNTVVFIGKDGDVLAEHLNPSDYPAILAQFPDGETTRVRETDLVTVETGIVPTFEAVNMPLIVVMGIEEIDQ